MVNIAYGENAVIPEGKKIGDLVPYDELEALAATSGTGADDIETAVRAYLKADSEAIATKTAEDTKKTLPVGYYVIVDTGLDGQGTGPVSKFIVEVVGAVSIQPKRSGTPVTEKKVDDKNDTTGKEDDTDWEDSADRDIGDDVPFQIKITVPAGIESYEKYEMIVHDTQSAGLTFNNDVEVTLNGAKLADDHWGVETDSSKLKEGETFQVIFANVNDFGKEGDVICINYTSKLNEHAVIGSEGNPNVMTLEYSDTNGTDGKSKTPEDKVIVFTYKTLVNKVDQDGKSLEGAAFRLEKKIKAENETGYELKLIKEFDVAEGQTTFEFKGLDDGDYVLTETSIPTGYNGIDPIEFTISATHDKESTDPQLLTFSGDKATGNADITSSEATEAGRTPENKVVNNKGIELPSTGGIGTTIFYTVGSILMLAAAVLLITRKKMSAYQD